MVIVYLCGGLGNQLFQYAFAKYLESNGYHVALEASHFSEEAKRAFVERVRVETGGGGGARCPRP